METISLLIVLLSFFPLYTPDTLAYDEALLGKWALEESNSALEFSEGWSEDSYSAIVTDQDGTQGMFDAWLVDLDGNLFLDMLPTYDYTYELDDLTSDVIVPMHVFFRVDGIGESLELTGIDPNIVYEYLFLRDDAVDYVMRPDEVLLLTASTEDVQSFILEILDVEEVFSLEFEMNRVE